MIDKCQEPPGAKKEQNQLLAPKQPHKKRERSPFNRPLQEKRRLPQSQQAQQSRQLRARLTGKKGPLLPIPRPKLQRPPNSQIKRKVDSSSKYNSKDLHAVNGVSLQPTTRSEPSLR